MFYMYVFYVCYTLSCYTVILLYCYGNTLVRPSCTLCRATVAIECIECIEGIECVECIEDCLDCFCHKERSFWLSIRDVEGIEA
jgi:hypothetical protein